MAAVAKLSSVVFPSKENSFVNLEKFVNGEKKRHRELIQIENNIVKELLVHKLVLMLKNAQNFETQEQEM